MVKLIDKIAVTDIAKVCHQAHRAYCETLDDYSQPKWEDAPQWLIDSAINGVMFYYENPDANARDGHERWMEEKHQTGWLYGPIKDIVKKEHPCLVPYDQLPVEQQVKDSIFSGIVKAFNSH